MPRLTDTMPLQSQFLKRNVKLLPCQKEMVKYWYDNQGTSINELARMFKVNKRLIQFILFPERLKKNLQDRKDRGGSTIYYKKDYHTKKIKEHRDHKKNVFGNG